MKTRVCFDADSGNAVALLFLFHLNILPREFVNNKSKIQTPILNYYQITRAYIVICVTLLQI